MSLGEKDQIIKTFCNVCKIEINHKICCCINSSGKTSASRDISMDGAVHEYFIEYEDSYQIIECTGCNTKSFRKMEWCSEYQDFDDPGIIESLYPSSNKNNRDVKEILETPYNIRETYKETITAYNNDLWVLAAAGLRSVLEGVCKHQNIIKEVYPTTRKNKKDLYTKIEDLYQKGIITLQQKETLHELRYLGNSALHELEIPSKDDISLGIDIIENMLQNLYEIPIKKNMLTNKRVKRENA
jgi:hypothetical protein